MIDRRWLNVIRAAMIALAVVAIVAQALQVIGRGVFDPTRYFAYFTIQSNLIGIVALGWLVLRREQPRTRGVELLRGAAAAYLTVTFAVTIVLLSDVDVGLQLPWVDFVLHKLFPVVVIADWIVDPPVVRLAYRDALIWLVYPVAWTLFTVARGAVDGWYPYPFLNPANGGYIGVAVVIAAISAGFLIVALAYIALGNALSRRITPRTA